MSIPTYVDPIPLPAPVTSGSGIQSYTDPLGDVWVAANGVNSGNWRRAREVLKARAGPSANTAVTPANAFQVVLLSTISSDTYGLVSSNRFNLPIAGWWRFHGSSAMGSGIARWIVTCFKNGAEYARGTDISNVTTASISGGVVNDTIPCAAGDYLELRVFCSIATLSYYGLATNYLTYATVAYDGTG